jgi:hypothetical protein
LISRRPQSTRWTDQSFVGVFDAPRQIVQFAEQGARDPAKLRDLTLQALNKDA